MGYLVIRGLKPRSSNEGEYSRPYKKEQGMVAGKIHMEIPELIPKAVAHPIHGISSREKLL